MGWRLKRPAKENSAHIKQPKDKMPEILWQQKIKQGASSLKRLAPIDRSSHFCDDGIRIVRVLHEKIGIKIFTYVKLSIFYVKLLAPDAIVQRQKRLDFTYV